MIHFPRYITGFKRSHPVRNSRIRDIRESSIENAFYINFVDSGHTFSVLSTLRKQEDFNLVLGLVKQIRNFPKYWVEIDNSFIGDREFSKVRGLQGIFEKIEPKGKINLPTNLFYDVYSRGELLDENSKGNSAYVEGELEIDTQPEILYGGRVPIEINLTKGTISHL